MEERMLKFFAVGRVRGVSFLLEAGGAIYVEQLDDGSGQVGDKPARLRVVGCIPGLSAKGGWSDHSFIVPHF